MFALIIARPAHCWLPQVWHISLLSLLTMFVQSSTDAPPSQPRIAFREKGQSWHGFVCWQDRGTASSLLVIRGWFISSG